MSKVVLHSREKHIGDLMYQIKSVVIHTWNVIHCDVSPHPNRTMKKALIKTKV